MPTVVNVNGEIGPGEAARIPVFDHGFLYGDSVYETLRAAGSRCLRLERHLDRLERSAAGIGLALPRSREDLAAEIARTLAAGKNAASAVRLIVTRGEGPVGLDPRLCPRPGLVIVVRPYEPLPEAAYRDGVDVILARTVRNSRRALDPGIKSGNFLNNIQAVREALAAAAFEALMLNEEAALAEGTQSNAFIVRAGRVATPDLGSGLLPGITRERVLELAREQGMGGGERPIFVAELYDADEVFLTSTLKGIVPVRRIGSHAVGDGEPGAVTRRLMALLQAELDRFTAAAS